MTSTPRSDHELLEAARSGDDAAYAELWSRHVGAAVLAARQFDHSGEAEDIVAEAFTRILAAIRAGGGPTTAFRPYLFRTVSNLAQRSAQQRRQTELSGDENALDKAVPFGDPLVEGVDRSYAMTAYRRLGREQQAVVWYVDVEGLANTETARLLGTTPAAVGSMIHRARETLRREFLQAHIDARDGRPECRQTLGRLGAYVRGTLTPRTRQRVEAHLDRCDDCRAALDELAGIAATLRAELLPLVLGPAAYGMAGQGTAAGTKSGSRAGVGAVVAAAAVALLLIGALAFGVVLWSADAPHEPDAGNGDRAKRGAPADENRPVSPAGEAVVAIHPSPANDQAVTDESAGDGRTVVPPEPPAGQEPQTSDGVPPAPLDDSGVSPDPVLAQSPTGSQLPDEPGPSSEPEPNEPNEPGEPGESEEPEPGDPEPPSEPGEPAEPELPEEPEPPEEPELLPALEATWQVVTDDAWDVPGRTYFVVDIAAADPDEQVEVALASPSPAGFSPIVGHLPAEPPLADHGVWDCGDQAWRPQQDCTAVAGDDGRVTAVFAVATGGTEAVVDLEITGEGREHRAVLLREDDGCPTPDVCEAPEPPGDHPDAP